MYVRCSQALGEQDRYHVHWATSRRQQAQGTFRGIVHTVHISATDLVVEASLLVGH